MTHMFRDNNKSLEMRISANERFGEFDLNAWLRAEIPISFGDKVLDVGCGAGNHLKIWSDLVGKDGMVVGMDNNQDLLTEAGRKKYKNNNVWLIRKNMDTDHLFPIRDVFKIDFDWVISNFSIYYSEPYYDKDMGVYYPKALPALCSIIDKEGTMVFSGPTERNAPELYEFNRAVAGVIPTTEEIRGREKAMVIEKQVVPYLSEHFRFVQTDFIDHRLVFPARKDFLMYYINGALCKESEHEVNSDKLITAIFDVFPKGDIIINKQTIIVQAKERK